MLSNPMNNWYTDSATIYRRQTVQDENGLDVMQEVVVYENIACRIFRSGYKKDVLTDTWSAKDNYEKLACHTQYVIANGDRIEVIRGARIGKARPLEVFYAGNMRAHDEPFGGKSPRIDHQEIRLANRWKD